MLGTTGNKGVGRPKTIVVIKLTRNYQKAREEESYIRVRRILSHLERYGNKVSGLCYYRPRRD